MSEFENDLRQAEADLAFALAQGEALAEDEAAQRIREIKERMEEEEAHGV